jgi:hypothetical protein
MTEPDTDQLISEDRRREIFRTLVETQDRAVPVAESRAEVARQYGVSESLVRSIEREGLDQTWPPL